MRKHFDHVLKMMGIRRPTRSAMAHGDPCARYEILLSAYTDGMLDDRKTALVEGHLNACAACRASLAATRLMSGSLSCKPAPIFTGEMSARLRMALAAERERMPRHVPIFTAQRIGAVGVACSLIAMVLFVNHSRHISVAVKPNAPKSTPATQVASNTVLPHNISAKTMAQEESAVVGKSSVAAELDSSSTAASIINQFSGGAKTTPVAGDLKPTKPMKAVFITPTFNSHPAPIVPRPSTPEPVALPTPSPAPTPEPAPAPEVANSRVPAAVETPQPAPETVALAPQPAPEPPAKPTRLMLASSVHISDEFGNSSGKLAVARPMHNDQGSGTFSMVASNFH